MKRMVFVIIVDIPPTSSPETTARLRAAGQELSTREEMIIDGPLAADFATAMETVVQIARRANACDNGKESEDEE